jgi:hypothetical protein
MEKKVSEELASLTSAYEKSKLSKFAILRAKNYSEDFAKGSSKTGIGTPHYSLLMNGVTQRDYGLMKVAYHVEPEEMGKVGLHGVFFHAKTHESAKLIKVADKTVEKDGNLRTYFDVTQETLEDDLRKAFDRLAKKLKSLGAIRTNLCDTCTKKENGCVVNPSGPVSSCSLHDKKA